MAGWSLRLFEGRSTRVQIAPVGPIEEVFAHYLAGQSQRLQLVMLSLGDRILNLDDSLFRPIKIDRLGKGVLKNRQSVLKRAEHLSIDFAQSGIFVRHLRRVDRQLFEVAAEIRAR